MKLLETMRLSTTKEMSLFAAQLLKEDIARLERVQQLAVTETDQATFRKKAMTLGWTQGDLRTFELNPELTLFLDAVYPVSDKPDQTAIVEAWNALHKRRTDLLVGCLSRPRLD